jgi:hypothetical protein
MTVALQPRRRRHSTAPGLFGRNAVAEADGRRWQFSGRGFWRRALQAADSAGSVVGEFVPRNIRRGGALHWAERELRLQPISVMRERYVLSEADRERALMDGKGWGRRPVKITLADREGIEPGLLLFAAFVVHQLAVKAANGPSASSTAALSGTYSGG